MQAINSNPRAVLVDHPLIQHKLSLLRGVDTDTKQFRELVGELAMLEAYEATGRLEVQDVSVRTPLCETVGKRLARHVAVVPILRAGIGMLAGFQQVVPSARVGFIGMQRNEQTHEPETYYQKLPRDIADCDVFLIDPMLATGGSSVAAVKSLREAGVARLTLMVLVAVPAGLEAVLAADPDVTIYTCAVDDRLNEQAYIVPGLGDAGDRTFGTL